MNKWILWAGIGCAAWFIFQIHVILLPFVLAFVLAYALNPIVTQLSKKLPRSLATSCVVIAVLFVVVCILLLLVPILQAQLLDFVLKIPNFVQIIWGKIKGILMYGRTNITEAQMYQLSDSVSQMVLNIFNGIGNSLSKIISGGVAVFSVLSLLLITPVVLFYVLRDWQKIKQQVKEIIPMNKQAKSESLMREINTTLAGFIRGQATVCLVLAIYYATALSLVGLDLGVLVGLLTGIFAFIPYVGFCIGVLLTALLALTQGATGSMWLWLLGVFAIGQILEGYILTPYFVGKRVGLHPVWIIFVLLAGGMIAGFLGVLLAVPVAAVCGVLIKHLLAWYHTTNFYKGDK
ncbi:MAG: AI-2E family transporter [Alphaproteobacteria bacterium]|nr:AI-2E family transporter [Alphaproteobacteria bacterium]